MVSQRKISWSLAILPVQYSISQNFPNPFNPTTTIKFDIAKNTFVNIKIFDILGREIYSLVNEELNAGSYTVDWDATGFSGGIYFYRISAGNYTETKKMILAK